jgi:CheY-like chemotaxis protein/predicted regulator of Ras-like GTPase activity (Roadblock/LC7/MglB family)
MKNVLIVDDEKSLVLTMQAGFVAYKDKFAVHTAENGKVATTILESTPIDLVVTDLKMPEMDGFELLVHLNAHFPNIPAIVMTAFGTPEIETNLKENGMLRLLEKPVDFDELTQAILKSIDGNDDGGILTGISLPSFLQLIEMEQNTCLMEVTTPSAKQGLLYFQKGILYDALYNDLKGEEAVYAMLAIDDVKISFRSLPNKRFKKNININLMTLLMEGVRRKDELKKTPEEEAILSDKNENKPDEEFQKETDDILPKQDLNFEGTSKGDSKMSEMFEVLEKLKVVNGFMAAGAFSPNGEMVAEVNTSGINLGELGALANDVLLKAQKATEMMNVGRGQVVHVEAPKAHVICRCLNEATDFAATATGRAHVHMVLLLNKEDGNVALGKMKMETVIQEIAEFFR